MPIRTVILITRLDLGGAQEVALETAARLDPARFDVRLLAGAGGALDNDARARLGDRYVVVPSLVHPISLIKDLWALLWLWRYFRRERIQVVHTHSSKAGLLGRQAAWLARVPCVVHTVHGWSFNDTQSSLAYKFYVVVERALARVTDKLVVVAQSCRDKGLLNGVGRPAQYALVRAAVDLGLWAASPKSKLALKGALAQARPGVRLRRLVVGCVANAKPQKNPLDFVRVAALIAQQRTDVSFVYIGDGPLRAQAETLAQESGVGAQVTFLGWQPDPRNLVAGFDVFLLTSLFEGLPCVFPQALSLGVPVVATAVDGASEIIKEGSNGYLCQPRDTQALADRVLALLSDAPLRRRMSRAAKISVPADYTFDAMVARCAQIYEAGAR